MKIYDYGGKKNISGDRVREARLQHKWSQNSLATQLQLKGVTIERDSISRIENGTRFITDYEVKVLSETLQVSALWLLGIA